MGLGIELPISHGVVTEILSYGAMVRLEDGSNGLVHISEVSEDYVYAVSEYLEVGMEVTVAVLADNNVNRKRLSIKQAGVKLAKLQNKERTQKKKSVSAAEKKKLKQEEKARRKAEEERRLIECPPEDDAGNEKGSQGNFEDELKKYVKDSENRLVDVKHQTEGKLGGSGPRKN